MKMMTIHGSMSLDGDISFFLSLSLSLSLPRFLPSLCCPFLTLTQTYNAQEMNNEQDVTKHIPNQLQSDHIKKLMCALVIRMLDFIF